MTDQTKTDSLFTSDMDYVTGMDTWSDLRLIHESESGWCVVYTGLYRGRRVTVKGLKREFRSSELHRSLLYKEFAVISGLSHQNIVVALWMAEVPNLGEAILMEYIDGITLADYLEINSTIEVAQIVDILRQLCSAVAYMHSRQTIHCDLKPSNVMITSSGFVKVIDFGMSRGNGFERLDFQGGTKGYTAPENFDHESKATEAVDIYSIGKILEQMDGKGIFKGVWKKCLSSNPEKRPASANEVFNMLDRTLSYSSKRRRIYKVSGIVAGIIVVAVCSFWIWRLIPSSEILEQASESIVDINPVSSDGQMRDSIFPPEIKESKEPEKIETVNHMDMVVTIGSNQLREDNATSHDAHERSYKEQYNEKFRQVLGLRFKQHLQLIDTMTTVQSNELQKTGHWRILVVRDMRKWLEEKFGSDYAKIEEEMNLVERHIEFEAAFSFRRRTELSYRSGAAKRCPELAVGDKVSVFFKGIDTLVVQRYVENRKLREERMHVSIDATDPEERMRIKGEYMKKAMED